MTERFYRDIAALKQAGAACLEYELPDLDTWVLSQLAARAGESILKLGGDSHEQIISLASKIGPHGYILTIDRSYQALHALAQHSQEKGLESSIRFLYLDLDDLGGHLRTESFDRASGGSALSHTQQPRAVLQALRQALKKGGVCFFYGPARRDLAELRLFQAALCNESREDPALLFIEQVGAACARETFPQVDFLKFEHPLRFTSPNALYAYWHASELYVEALDRDFRRAAVQHFQAHATFETAQRLLGVRAING